MDQLLVVTMGRKGKCGSELRIRVVIIVFDEGDGSWEFLIFLEMEFLASWSFDSHWILHLSSQFWPGEGLELSLRCNFCTNAKWSLC